MSATPKISPCASISATQLPHLHCRSAMSATNQLLSADENLDWLIQYVEQLTDLTKSVTKIEIMMDDLSITVNKLSSTIGLAYCRPGMTGCLGIGVRDHAGGKKNSNMQPR